MFLIKRWAPEVVELLKRGCGFACTFLWTSMSILLCVNRMRMILQSRVDYCGPMLYGPGLYGGFIGPLLAPGSMITLMIFKCFSLWWVGRFNFNNYLEKSMNGPLRNHALGPSAAVGAIGPRGRSLSSKSGAHTARLLRVLFKLH